MKIFLALLLLCSCASPVDVPSPEIDAAIIQHDAGQDAFVGAPDLGVDAGPVCECTSGPCCDGCRFRAATFQCSTRAAGPYTQAQCGVLMMNVCGGSDWSRIEMLRIDRWCTGDASECTGRTSGQGTLDSMVCDSDGLAPYVSRCVVDTGTLGAHCEACP